MLIYIVILSSVFGAFGQYLNKHLVNIGISRKDYFYYMCLSMIPFSLMMLVVEYFNRNLRFEFTIIPFILLFMAMFFRYKKQHTIVGCLKYLNPYEDSAYLTLNIVLAFIIDVLLGIKGFNYVSFLSILLTVLGIFILSNFKLKISNLRKDLLIRILSSLIMGYITHYILQYWSNAIYILLLNLFLTIMFSRNYTFKYNNEHSRIIKWVFIQQIFGFTALYLSNYLASNSVTLSSYVKPVSIILVVIISMFFKEKDKKPSMKQFLAIILVVIGVMLI